jgi:hypothetical protein
MEINGDGGGGGAADAEERGRSELVPLLEAIKTSEVRLSLSSPRPGPVVALAVPSISTALSSL